jgi:hypothetical protein
MIFQATTGEIEVALFVVLLIKICKICGFISIVAAAPAAPPAAKAAESVPPPSSGGTRKLKDYLPYMKNRNAPRSLTPQGKHLMKLKLLLYAKIKML